MIRTLTHAVLEVARAIDTGHAIKHGVTPATYRQGGPLAPSEGVVALGPHPLDELEPLS